MRNSVPIWWRTRSLTWCCFPYPLCVIDNALICRVGWICDAHERHIRATTGGAQ